MAKGAFYDSDQSKAEKDKPVKLKMKKNSFRKQIELFEDTDEDVVFDVRNIDYKITNFKSF